MLNVRRLCDTLRRDAEVDFGPDKLTRLLRVLCRALRRGQGQRSFFALRPQSADSRYLKAAARLAGDRDHPRTAHAAGAGADGRVPARRRQAIRCWSPASRDELETALQADTTLADLRIENGTGPVCRAALPGRQRGAAPRPHRVFPRRDEHRLNPRRAGASSTSPTTPAGAALPGQNRSRCTRHGQYAGIAIGKAAGGDGFRARPLQPRACRVRAAASPRRAQDVLEMATTEAPPQDPHRARQPPEQQAIVAARAKATTWCWPARARARRG